MSGHVFISYVRENSDVVERLAAALGRAGLTVWIDRQRLEPGDRWRQVVRDAIRSGDLFIACFSREFASRTRSHMHEELTLAIDELRVRPTDRTWFIPIVIDDSEVPDRSIGAGESLRDLQWVDLAHDWDGGVASIVAVAFRDRPDTTPGKQNASSASGAANLATEGETKMASVALAPSILRLTYVLQRGASYWRNVSHNEIRILVSVINDASVSALGPHIRLEVSRPFSIGPLGITSRQPDAPLQLIAVTADPPISAIVGKPEFAIHPSDTFQISEVAAMVKGNAPVPACLIRYWTTAHNLLGGEGTLNIEAAEIAHAIGRAVEPIER